MGKVRALKRGMERRHTRRGRRRRRKTLCFIVLCMFCLEIFVSATPGSDFLNVKEDQLAMVADAVQTNDAHKCELLKTCTATNCSRNTCLPEEDDFNKFTCMPVPVGYFKYCNASAPGCRNMNLDYTRSYVRLPANTDLNSVPTTIVTCAQRLLDPVFRNLSTPASLTRIYFGSVDGSMRLFPGRDQDVNDPECGGFKFDSRVRPWYRTSTYVPKVVVILVDAGPSMSSLLSSGQGNGTILDAVKVIVREYFKTLFVRDYVNIIMFDSSKVSPLSPSMVQVQSYRNLSDTTYLPELDPLLESLDKQKSEDQPGTGISDVAKGIDIALSNLATLNLDAAKIILVLTDAKFATSSNISIPVTNLTSSNVKVFIYKIPQANDDTLFLGNTTSFANQLCSIGASFEVISSDLSNPLLALKSLFTFTATLHAALKKSAVDYSIIYPGYEQTEGNTFTLSKPVFSANKTLLGVVGMDILIEDLENLTSLVEAATLNRSVGEVFKSADFVLTNGGCSQLQTELPSATPCEPGVAIAPNGGFCPRTDQTSTIEDRACCGSCSTRGGGSMKLGVIAAAVICSIVVNGLVLFLLWFFCFRNTENPGGGTSKVHNIYYPGPDNEVEDPEKRKDNVEDLELRPTEDFEAGRVPVYLSTTNFLEVGYMKPLIAALDFCDKQAHELVNLLPSVIIFIHLCTHVVDTLSPAAQMNFERYHNVLRQNQDQFKGVEIPSNLHNIFGLCIDSLVELARRFQLAGDLLKKCGSPEWYKSALELADVRPPRHIRRWSEFSLAIRDCEWSLDIVELAFHALEKLLTEGAYTLKDVTFKWSKEKERMILQIPGAILENQNSTLEVCRDWEEMDLDALLKKASELVDSEKAKQRFYRGPSSTHNIAIYLITKLKGPTPEIDTYLPYSFSGIKPSSLTHAEYVYKGGGGMVAKYRWNKIQVAVKSVRCLDMSMSDALTCLDMRRKFEKEAAVLGLVQHPNVVRFFGCGFIEKSNTGLLVMELMNHDLCTIIKSRLKELPKGSSPFSPIVAIDIMLQIGQAMRYLEEHKVLHRDVKAKNIVVNCCKPLSLVQADSASTNLLRLLVSEAVLPHTQENYMAKLADFGLAKCLTQPSYATTLMAGTTGWRAPELFNMRDTEVDQRYNLAADVYSFGMTCTEILTGKRPFEDEPYRGSGLHEKIVQGVRPSLDNLKPEVPEPVKELIRECWDTDPNKRPNFDEIVKRLWECKVLAILPGFERKTKHVRYSDRANQ